MKNFDIHDVFKAKDMLRVELLPYFGPKEMVVFARLNRATYQIVDPNRDLFKLEEKEET